jgi:hypothetical protein
MDLRALVDQAAGQLGYRGSLSGRMLGQVRYRIHDAGRRGAYALRDLADRFDPSEVLSARAYEAGYRVAADEITQGIACHVYAKERGLYPGDQDQRVAWSRGYDAAICAHRLGLNVAELVRGGMLPESLVTPHGILEQLDAGKTIRPDPRQRHSVSAPEWQRMGMPTVGVRAVRWQFSVVPLGAEVRVVFPGLEGAASARVAGYDAPEGREPLVLTDRFGAVPASMVWARAQAAEGGAP